VVEGASESLGNFCKISPKFWTLVDSAPSNQIDCGRLTVLRSFVYCRIEKIIILTLLPLGEHVPKTDAKCFELYGFDVLLDEALKPWLIEVNFSPSLGGDSTTDQTVKEGLIEDVIDTLDFRVPVEKADSASSTTALESNEKYIEEYDRFLSRTPATHRTQALALGGVGSFDVIFPFNEETRDAATKYSDLEESEVQQTRIVQEVEKKYGKFVSPKL